MTTDATRPLTEAEETVARILASGDWEAGVRYCDIGSREDVAQYARDIVAALTARAAGGVLTEVAAERASQDAKWGPQNHPDGTGPHIRPLGRTDINLDLRTGAELAWIFQRRCQANETPNWRDILLEEVFEAVAEDSSANLRTELIQVAAVAVAWVQAIDRRPPDRNMTDPDEPQDDDYYGDLRYEAS